MCIESLLRIEVYFVEELIFEDVGDLIKFVIVVDGDKDILAVIVLFLLEDNILDNAVGVCLAVLGDERKLLVSVKLARADKLKLELVALFVCQCIVFGFKNFFCHF